ncbi:MAG: hypothetical protein IJQ16_05900 [Selenomonadaceae bacterium]|nr:hypothetical protein [Selenomonadaceae bacterium]
MIKGIIMFLFGNALWDKLVEYFGSTDAVIEAGIVVVVIALLIKFHEEIIGLAILLFILWAIFH